jgi:hypothetical protein
MGNFCKAVRSKPVIDQKAAAYEHGQQDAKHPEASEEDTSEMFAYAAERHDCS